MSEATLAVHVGTSCLCQRTYLAGKATGWRSSPSDCRTTFFDLDMASRATRISSPRSKRRTTTGPAQKSLLRRANCRERDPGIFKKLIKPARPRTRTFCAGTLHEPGLIAYGCSSCGYITSVLLPPADQRRR
jgi:hypothetical protein